MQWMSFLSAGNSLSPLSWFLKAVHSSCLYSRAPETRQVRRTQLTQILLLFCKVKHMAVWGGRFHLRCFHSPLLRMTTYFLSYHTTESRQLRRRKSLCCILYSIVSFESINTCIGDMHSKAHTFLDRNVRFCGTSLTAHPPPVTNLWIKMIDKTLEYKTKYYKRVLCYLF